MPGHFVRLKDRIRTIIEGHDAGQWPHTCNVLSGASRLYGLLTHVRHKFYDRGLLKSHRLPCRVISVGNLTVGGTGKTPMAIYIARHLRGLGYKVAILSRGYGGRAEKKGGIVSDGLQMMMDPDNAGDEAFMMADKLEGIPVLVGQNRYRSGITANKLFNCEIIILDDGYQHRRLQRDLNLLLLDAKSPFGNGHLLPRGPLRSPKSSSQRADAFVFTRCTPEIGLPELPAQTSKPSMVFHTRHRPVLFKAAVPPNAGRNRNFRARLEPIAIESIVGTKVVGFSGIANNLDFKRSLLSFGVLLQSFLSFGDHHRYSDEDLHVIQSRCSDADAEWLATTEKDFYRLCHRFHPKVQMLVVGIEIEFLPNPDGFHAFMDSACQGLDARV